MKTPSVARTYYVINALFTLFFFALANRKERSFVPAPSGSPSPVGGRRAD